MAEMLNDIDTPSDAELISRVRGGDVDAYGQLFARHVGAARRLARQLVRGPDSDDLVSEAFTKVMGALQSGGGPDIAFRAYLLTAVRRLHVDRIRAQSRLTPSEDMTEFDPGVPFQDTVVEQFESGAAARAFASLPERWQMVLWHLEVERQKPADVAPLLGMTANSVSALAYRAREGLRQAFLAAHLAEIDDAECSWVVEHLGSYVRKGLSKRDTGKIDAHLEGCRTCAAMNLELVEVNSDLSGVLAPLLLGGLAAGYLGATASGGAAGGLVALFDRAKDFVVSNVVPVAAGSTAAGVAAAVVIAGGMDGGGRFAEPEAGAAAPPSRAGSVEAVGPARTVVGDKAKDGGGGKDGGSRDTVQERPGGRSGPEGDGGAGGSDTDPGGDAGSGNDTDTEVTQPGTGPGEPGSGAPSASPPTAAPTEQPEQPEQPDKDPTPTSKPTPSETVKDGDDVALTLSGNALSKGIGRFKTHVTNLPTGQGPTTVALTITFSRGDVHLESVPHDCSASGSSVTCTANGGTHNAQFDADMSAMKPTEKVTITVTVSLPDSWDPDTSDNTRSITLTRVGKGRELTID